MCLCCYNRTDERTYTNNRAAVLKSKTIPRTKLNHVLVRKESAQILGQHG